MSIPKNKPNRDPDYTEPYLEFYFDEMILYCQIRGMDDNLFILKFENNLWYYLEKDGICWGTYDYFNKRSKKLTEAYGNYIMKKLLE